MNGLTWPDLRRAESGLQLNTEFVPQSDAVESESVGTMGVQPEEFHVASFKVRKAILHSNIIQ